MISRQSPELLSRRNPLHSRRVKSEIPNFFKESNNISFTHLDSRPSFPKLPETSILKSKSHCEDTLSRHREVILALLKPFPVIDPTVLPLLKDLTIIPDLLSDIIYKYLRGDRTTNASPINNQSEEVNEYKKYTSNLQTQLLKAKRSNDELTNMLLSVEVQQKMSVSVM